MDKGTLSNVLSAAVFGTGLCLPHGFPREIVLSIGLFAFSGGITNSLAVKMLFDRIPGLAGSGVIPARFREIRTKLKSLISEHFFSPEYLHRYFAEEGRKIPWSSYVKRPGQAGGVAAFLGKQWDRVASPEALAPLVDRQLEKLMDSSIGGLLMMVGTDNVKPAVTQFLTSFAATMKAEVLEAAARVEAPEGSIELDTDKLIADLRPAVDRLLERKLEELTPQAVKRMMEDVIRSHLGWLVVWGNVFGAVLGVVPVLLPRLLP